jgi:hypothetical protein
VELLFCGGSWSAAQGLGVSQPPADRPVHIDVISSPQNVFGLGLCSDVNRTWLWTNRSHGYFKERPKFRLCADMDWTWSRTNCGHGHGLVSDWTRTDCGCGLDATTVRPRTGRGCGHSADMDWSRPGCGHGLDTDTAGWPDNGEDIPRPHRDHFADIRTLKMQGVRRPLSNSHKSCEPSRRIFRISRVSSWPDFRTQG